VRKHGSVWNPPALAVGRFNKMGATLAKNEPAERAKAAELYHSQPSRGELKLVAGVMSAYVYSIAKFWWNR
jgi:hypothetical protein